MAMTATLVLQKDSVSTRMVKVSIAASGSYTSTGDTLDLTGKGILASQPPLWGQIQGQSGFGYEFVRGTTLANGKVKVRINDAGGANAAQAEHSAASLVAGVTGDTIEGLFVFNKE